jgi:hypothetical protein
MRSPLSIALFSFAALAQGPGNAPIVPDKHIPPTVLMELRSLENQFDLALGRDCAIERCVSKGCVYQDHTVVDIPRNTSLPGLNQNEGLGSVPPQEYLTQAHCDFVHEKSVAARDVQALVKRLEQRLSKGWLRVTVGRQILEPISPSLRESPPEKPAVEKPAPPPPAPPVPVVEAKPTWQSDVALRELWLTLLPHFWWMLGVVFFACAVAFLIWAARRVGRESIEEKAMLAQLESEKNSSIPIPIASSDTSVSTGPPVATIAPPGEAFVAEQKARWTQRIQSASTEAPDSATNEVVSGVLRDWLKAERFDLLAKANLQFGENISASLPVDGALAQRKVEFSHYLKTLDVATLPSDEDFFRALNHEAISSSVLSQSDAMSFHGLREEFGSEGIVQLIQTLPARFGALLFGMISNDSQREVARMLSDDARFEMAAALLTSRRIAQGERAYLFSALNAARAGRPLPSPAAIEKHDTVDRGYEFDGPLAVSEVMPFLESNQRKHLFDEALGRANGAFPSWYEEILYPQMLSNLAPELCTDLLLQIDSKRLSAWISLQNALWQQGFLGKLPTSLQNALASNGQFASSLDRTRQAQAARRDLSAAVQQLVSNGKTTFSELFV